MQEVKKDVIVEIEEGKNYSVRQIRVSESMISLLEELREIIANATSQSFAESLTWGQLCDVLVDKIKKAKIEFGFP